jgi:hypothetical protein
LSFTQAAKLQLKCECAHLVAGSLAGSWQSLFIFFWAKAVYKSCVLPTQPARFHAALKRDLCWDVLWELHGDSHAGSTEHYVIKRASFKRGEQLALFNR